MKWFTCDGNTAAATIAYAFSDVSAIYPITPSSPMAELCDEAASQGRKNLFGQTVRVAEMQSEAGAAGAVHGSLAAGALTTTFTASQGLLLMLPTMAKISGELLPGVFHVSARALAYHALSIFGDHSDVMAARPYGFAMLASDSVQMAADMAAVAHVAAIKSSVPFLHFFDGFRTSHEIQKIKIMEDSELATICPFEEVEAFRARSLNPEHPHQTGTAQNPDVYFQGREASNKYYNAVPEIVQATMDKVAAITGRQYHLFDYEGAPDAERVIVVMGSGGDTCSEAIAKLNAMGEKVGVVHVRLYRPWKAEALIAALPKTVKTIAVLDRTKESGSQGEPLYQDVAATVQQAGLNITVVGGRFGLGSKEFAPVHVKAVFDMLAEAPRHNFTVGIDDDVTHLSLPIKGEFNAAPEGAICCKFYGLGSDGTVGANKNSIKIIGDHTDLYAQAYFSYDSKKSGGLTVSHLRFGKKPIQSPYLIDAADFIACHNPAYVTMYDMVSSLKDGGVFLLNCPWTAEELDKHLPVQMKKLLAKKNAKLYIIDAIDLAAKVKMGKRINTIMQAAFFKLADVIPYEQADEYMKAYAKKTYGKKGDAVVQANYAAIDIAVSGLNKVEVPADWANAVEETAAHTYGNAYVDEFAMPVLRQEGDKLPVSKVDASGTVPTATTQYEKRGIAVSVPKWDIAKCIQCGMCVMSCPHACIRAFYPEEGAELPQGFEVKKATGKEFAGRNYRIQVSPMDCTGCGVCANVCIAKDKALFMTPLEEMADEQKLFDFAMTLPEVDVAPTTVKAVQAKRPLFEFSGACAGCGETPYLGLLTRLFGDRMIIANATGCSSIYGGSAPTCPYAVNQAGHGPAWANSLFENNAEFGYGMNLAVEKRREALGLAVKALAASADEATAEKCNAWLAAAADAEGSRAAGEALKAHIEGMDDENAKIILANTDLLTKKSVWIIGGDGWSYDIGFGGLDHVLASGEDVNVLVLDTEVYSNTGGQSSKATPIGATAKFAAAGKETGKKDLGRIAMTYGNVYVAYVSMGADQAQVLKAMKEAEAYPGPSLIVAYAPCINHGINMQNSQKAMKDAVACGYWWLYRYNPAAETKLVIDKINEPDEEAFRKFVYDQVRYSALVRANPERAEALLKACTADVIARQSALRQLAAE